MNFDKLEQSVKNLNIEVNKFPICAISLDDLKPVEEKIQTARMSLMHLNARFLIFAAKFKRMLLKLYSMRFTVILESLALHYRIHR